MPTSHTHPSPRHRLRSPGQGATQQRAAARTGARKSSGSGARKSSGRLAPALAAILAVLGVTVLLYPPASQWVNQLRQSRIIAAYADLTANSDPPQHEQIRRAHEYNSLLADGGLVDIAGHVPTIREQQAQIKTPQQHDIPGYDKQLLARTDGLMGRIRVPAADVDLPFYHGTSDETLLKGAGHLQGTALPVGGIGTRAVITAHRGLADHTMFTHLDRVGMGDEFVFEVFGEVLVYKVVDIQVVEPENVESIRPNPHRDLATLITCTPLGINSQRIVVTGERVHPTPDDALEDAGKASDLPRFPWWIVVWVGTVVGAITFYVWLRPQKNSEDLDASQHPNGA